MCKVKLASATITQIHHYLWFILLIASINVSFLFVYPLIKSFVQIENPGGRVVSAVDCHAWELGFDSNSIQFVLSEKSRVIILK